MKKILLISTLYKPNVGGIENSIHHLAIEYEKLGYCVDVVASDRNNVTKEKLPLLEKVSSNISIYRYATSKSSILNFFYSMTSLYSLLKKLTKNEGYEFIVARSSLSVIACAFAKLKNINYLLPGVAKFQSNSSNIVTSLSIHRKLRFKLSNSYNHTLQYIAVRCATKNFVFSDNMKKQVNEALGVLVNTPILKPGVDKSRFYNISAQCRNDLRIRHALPIDKKVILGLGRFVKAKGFHVVIEALKHLPDEYCVCLVGHGAEYDMYNDLAKKNNVTDRLFIKPPTDKPEEYYQLADFFAMTSTYEPLGQTILEAQACGLPIIALDPRKLNITTAIYEVTDKDTRGLCEQNNAEALAEVIVSTDRLNTSSNINREDISKYAHKNFSWGTLALSLRN